MAGIAASLLLLRAASATPATTLILCVFWAFAINFYNLAFQAEIIRNATKGTAVAMSIYSGIYNVGIGGGALAGGYVCSGISIADIGYAGGAVALIAAIICFRKLLPSVSDPTARRNTDTEKRTNTD